MTTSTITVRLDDSLKKRVDDVSKRLGLSTSAAFTIFANQYADRHGFPFDVRIPESADTESKENYAVEMNKRLLDMASGNREYHDLIDAKA